MSLPVIFDGRPPCDLVSILRSCQQLHLPGDRQCACNEHGLPV